MKIPKIIDFGISNITIYGSHSKQYKAMSNLEEKDWDKWFDIMLRRGVNIVYSLQADKYIVYPS